MTPSSPSADRIALSCPQCHARLKAPRQLVGKVCPCPQCRAQVKVTAPIPSDADIALVLEEEERRNVAPPANRWV